MKNKIGDLRNHMFEALERLNDPSITEDQLKNEVIKANAISELGKVIVDSAKTEILYAKLTRREEDKPTRFLEAEEEPKKVERPAAVYTNKNHAQA